MERPGVAMVGFPPPPFTAEWGVLAITASDKWFRDRMAQ